VELAAGFFWTCVVAETGPTVGAQLSCTGLNGLETTATRYWGGGLSVPVETTSWTIVQAPDVPHTLSASIASYGFNTCTLSPEGAVGCSGANRFGQLGDGTTVDRNTIPAGGIAGGPYASVSAGGDHTCAIADTLDRYICFGLNTDGQLGRDWRRQVSCVRGGATAPAT
jgi:alpha-tubulin suppressor-like RCC1 family protein